MNPASQPGFFRWQPRCWLHVSGPDAATFLQGQFTNDLRGLTSGARYGLWLNVKGKVVADSFVVATGRADEFWICSYHSAAADIRARLESHIIADDVTINDQSEQWVGVSLFESDAAHQPDTVSDGVTFQGRRHRGRVVEWVLPLPTAAERQAKIAGLGRELDEAEVELRRIDAEIPKIGVDLGAADLPNEAGLEADAISYNKGCYLGQEVMARLKSMGQVRRRLLKVTGKVAMPPVPAPLFVGERQVGELRSCAVRPTGELVGLAMLSLLHTQSASDVRLGSPDGCSLRIERGAGA